MPPQTQTPKHNLSLVIQTSSHKLHVNTQHLSIPKLQICPHLTSPCHLTLPLLQLHIPPCPLPHIPPLDTLNLTSPLSIQLSLPLFIKVPISKSSFQAPNYNPSMICNVPSSLPLSNFPISPAPQSFTNTSSLPTFTNLNTYLPQTSSYTFPIPQAQPLSSIPLY